LTSGSNGTLGLRASLFDTVCNLQYVARNNTSVSGGALWDIFPPSQENALRAFIDNTRLSRRKVRGGMPYLDATMMFRFCNSQADESSDVDCENEAKSYRIYQKVGQMVFIPAGYIYQVR